MPRDLLRPVAVCAMALVRAETQHRPPRPVPHALVPLLRFRQLASKAVDAVVVVLEQDSEFRARVRDATTEREIGRVGWLWLARPDGWDVELRDALGELAADGGAPSVDDVGSEARLRRRLAGAERAAVRAQDLLERRVGELERLREEHRTVVAERDAHQATARALQTALDAANDERRRAVKELKRVEKLLARRDDERRQLESRLATSGEGSPQSRVADSPPPSADPLNLGPPMAKAAAAAEQIERFLGEAALSLDALRAELTPFLSSARSSPVSSPPSASPAGAAAVRRKGQTRRQARRMPRGLVDDSVAAAAWLLSESPALLVDGYNVSMAAWPDQDIAHQRERLERLLCDLAARLPGLTTEVIYDGDAIAVVPSTLPARTRVNVRFTTRDVEADDVLLEMIAQYPLERTVVVVSSDRRVRDGARARGANVLSSHQLLAVGRG